MESFQSPCSCGGKTAARSAAPGAEYPPGVPARAGRGREKHSSERRDRIGTSARSPSLLDRGSSRRSTAHRFEACASFPAARTPSPAARGAVWSAIQEELLLFRPEKWCRHWRLRSGQFVARLLL